MTNETENEDPIDDSTHWVGRLPVSGINGDKHTNQRDTGGKSKPNNSSKESPVAKGKTPKHLQSD